MKRLWRGQQTQGDEQQFGGYREWLTFSQTAYPLAAVRTALEITLTPR
jgi:hypothetical protein